MAAFEGAEAARATATGMAAVTTALMGQVRAGDHVVAAKALFGSCRWVVEDWLPRFGVASTLVDGIDLDPMAEGGAAEHQGVLPRTPDQPDARSHRHRRGRQDRARRPAPSWWSTTCSRPRSTRARCARRRLRRLFGDQAHRRPGPLSRRRRAGVARRSSRITITSSCGRPGRRLSPFNAWVLLKGLETLSVRVAAADRNRRHGRRCAGRPDEDHAR